MRISLQHAAKALLNGQVVAVPTETVYGLAASITRPTAIARIFSIKGRPASNPLIVHLSSLTEMASYLLACPEGFEALAEAFWPGPLTIVLPVNQAKIPAIARAGLETAGFRIPSHPLALELLHHTGPLVMPSANVSGKPSATAAEHVEFDFGADFPVLDGSCCPCGLESTILTYVASRWCIIRLGAIPRESFLPVLGYVPEIVTKEAGQKPLCPGQSFRHYAPKASLLLVKNIQAKTCGTLLGFADRTYPAGMQFISLGSSTQPEEVAENLYARLRELDLRHIEQAMVDMNFPQEGLWLTIAERLERAAQG